MKNIIFVRSSTHLSVVCDDLLLQSQRCVRRTLKYAQETSIIITGIYFGEGNKALISSLGNCVKCLALPWFSWVQTFLGLPSQRNVYIYKYIYAII